MNTRYFSDVKLYLHEKIKEYFIKLIIVQIFIGLVLGIVIYFNWNKQRRIQNERNTKIQTNWGIRHRH